MQRNNLPPPATYIDTYLHDICLSLRELVDLATPAAPPEPAADAVTELREPRPAMTTRDAMIAADQAVAPTGPPDAPTGAQPAAGDLKGIEVRPTRRHPRAN